MICPNCLSGLGTIIVKKKKELRRRKCTKCNHRFSTVELNLKLTRTKVIIALELLDEILGL